MVEGIVKFKIFIIISSILLPGYCVAALPPIKDSFSTIEVLVGAVSDMMGVMGYILMATMVSKIIFVIVGDRVTPSLLGALVIGSIVTLYFIALLLIPSEDVGGGGRILPVTTDTMIGFGYTVLVPVIIFLILGVIGVISNYLINKDESTTDLNVEKNTIEKRLFTLKNKADKLAENCIKENIEGLSFLVLSTVSNELIELLKNNKNYLDSRKVNRFFNSNINIYLKFLDEYESIMGRFDEARRNKVEEGVLDMIAAIKEVSQSIVDDKFLEIDVKASVIKQIR